MSVHAVVRLAGCGLHRLKTGRILACYSRAQGQSLLIDFVFEVSKQLHQVWRLSDRLNNSVLICCAALYCAVLCCRYLYSSDNAVVAGALLAIGLVNCGVQNENDPGW